MTVTSVKKSQAYTLNKVYRSFLTTADSMITKTITPRGTKIYSTPSGGPNSSKGSSVVVVEHAGFVVKSETDDRVVSFTASLMPLVMLRTVSTILATVVILVALDWVGSV